MREIPFTKTRSVIADELGVTRKTFRLMLRRNGINLPKEPVYRPWQKLIYETFSYPEDVHPDLYKEIPLPSEKN